MAHPDHASPPSSRLRLGTFCTNAAPFLVRDPDGWRPTWERGMAAARIADTAGLDAVVPLARWKGFMDGRPDHISHDTLDPFVFATGVAQVTSRITVFATVQAASMHPVVVAKQGATIDAASGGRFAINVVGGWNPKDNAMLDVSMPESADRYGYLTEWLHALRGLWESEDEVDSYGRLRIGAGLSRPQPTRRVPVMNAGLSPTGARFAAEHADIVLVNLSSADPADWRTDVQRHRDLARTFGRTTQVWTNTVVLQRDTTEEATAELEHFMTDLLDPDGLEAFMDMLGAGSSLKPGTAVYEATRRRVGYGGGSGVVGSATDVADQLGQMSEAGIDGVLLTWADPVDGLRRFVAEVLPLLERRGLRLPASQAGHLGVAPSGRPEVPPPARSAS